MGINHVALWARSRAEIDRFHDEFLVTRSVPVVYSPREYPRVHPGYYAVFFDDPINGIQWELARLPTIRRRPRRGVLAGVARLPAATPGMDSSVAREAMRTLPGVNAPGSERRAPGLIQPT